jgi:class 3 adenylate cyclase
MTSVAPTDRGAPVAGVAVSAETRLARLLQRLLDAAATSLAAGDLEPARSTAEEVRAVDPDNRRAAEILRAVSVRRLGPSGERALMTLLFSDLVGSTMLSERVEPEQLRDLFAFYRAAARDAVQRYRGSLVHYSGDGILASFGHPEAHEDDARRAVLAGLDLATAMRDARTELDRRFGVAPEVRVGIHTGRVVVTDLSGDDSVADRDSIVGLVPNLAARIQQEAEPGTVVISDVTQQLVDADFYLRSLAERRLKGISRPVEVFAVERPRYAAARFLVDRYRKAGLVGRDEPRARLLAAWQTVQPGAGTSAAFLVVGEPGIGKSRLSAEILDRVEASGGRVLGAACLPYYADVSLWPIARMFDRMLEGVPDPAGRLRWLTRELRSVGLDPGRLIPFLGPVLGIPATADHPAPELDPSAFLDERLERLVDWLAAAARETPHLFVVEDLHWADPSTLALLGRVVQRQPAGILTLATTRDDSVVAWRSDASVLRLPPLDRSTANRLIDNLTAGQPLSDDRRAVILRHAEGIPLFIEELARSGLDHRQTEPMPMRLQELLTWRLRAPRVDLRLVQVAATIGPTFDPSLVAAVLGDEDAVAHGLEVLVEAGIVEPLEATAGAHRFRHSLMRDAAYETQVLDVRRATHAAVADALVARGAEPALIAQHLAVAGAAERAVGLYLEAARSEQRRGAHPETVTLVSRALALLEDLPESDDRALAELAARMARGPSLSSMHGYFSPDVEADFRRAQALAARLGRPEVLPALIAIWAYWLSSARLGEAEAVLDQLTAMVGEAAFASFEPEVLGCVGYQDFKRGDLRSAQERLERSMAGMTARPRGHRVSPLWPLPNDPLAAGAGALAAVNAARGELEEATRWDRQAMRRCQKIGPPRGAYTVAHIRSTFSTWMHHFLGDDDAMRRAAAEAVALSQQHGYSLLATFAAAWAGNAEPGDAPDRQVLEQSLEALARMGQQGFFPGLLARLAELDAAAGDHRRADEHLAEAFDMVRRTGEELDLPELLRQRARFTLAGGGPAGPVVADLREAVRLATERGARVSRLRAAVDLARLPARIRPDDWRSVLVAAKDDMPGSASTVDTTAAEELLDRGPPRERR